MEDQVGVLRLQDFENLAQRNYDFVAEIRMFADFSDEFEVFHENFEQILVLRLDEFDGVFVFEEENNQVIDFVNEQRVGAFELIFQNEKKGAIGADLCVVSLVVDEV
jgi:hypothetical protein